MTLCMNRWPGITWSMRVMACMNRVMTFVSLCPTLWTTVNHTSQGPANSNHYQRLPWSLQTYQRCRTLSTLTNQHQACKTMPNQHHLRVMVIHSTDSSPNGACGSGKGCGRCNASRLSEPQGSPSAQRVQNWAALVVAVFNTKCYNWVSCLRN